MKLFGLSLVVVFLMGCLFTREFIKGESGPDAVVYWRVKDKHRQKTSAEVEEYMKQLDKKVEEYMLKNPGLSDETKKWLKVFNTVHIGMTKEQVLLLLEDPARKEPVSEHGANEKWVYIGYHPYGEDHLYFKGDTLIKIFEYQTGNVL